jgi:ABC-type Zn uptake system ZnuABC Zn-binding protein ZnuA
VALAAAAATMAGALTACGAAAASTGSAASPPGSGAAHKPAPLHVAVSVYALAQLVSYIGGPDVDVVDLAPPGVQPQGLKLGRAQRAEMRSAGVVISVGDGYQPEVEAAARSDHRYLAVLPAVSGQAQPDEFWLDPYLMAKAAAAIAGAMTAADPAGRQQFRNGSLDFQAVAGSIESDFESTFTQCQDSYLVTADDAFGRMAASFDLVDVPVSTAGVSKAVNTLSVRGLTGAFSEVGVPSGPLQQVARRAGVRVKSLNPLELTPVAGTGTMSYFALMEQDLTTMEGPLGCDTSDEFS